MPEPYQPVDHWAAFKLVPVNSESNLSVQWPGTPTGTGVTAREGGVDVGVGPAFVHGLDLRGGSVDRAGGTTGTGVNA